MCRTGLSQTNPLRAENSYVGWRPGIGFAQLCQEVNTGRLNKLSFLGRQWFSARQHNLDIFAGVPELLYERSKLFHSHLQERAGGGRTVP
jgi:hypothetical protein